MNARNSKGHRGANELRRDGGFGLRLDVVMVAVLGTVASASAEPTAYERQSYASSFGARRMSYAACDRARVRECQADAKQHVQFCEAFSGRLACADRALKDLQICWAATGCW